MKFFFINNSLNPNILGHYPQVKEIKQNCHVWDEPKFIEHVDFEKIDFEPITANAILHTKSKLTDLISVTRMGFTRKLLMSGQLKTILENNRKEGLQFFQSNLILNNHEIENYWILNMYNINMEFIEFSQSDIYLTEYTVNKIEKLNINSYEQYSNIKSEIDKKGYPAGIMIENIRLNSNIQEHFFAILNVMGGVKYIVSENLKKEIEDAGCTGIEFQPVELSYQEWSAPGGERERIYGKL